MRTILLAVLMSFSFFSHANSDIALPPDKLEARVRQVNEAQNRVMLKGSTMENVEALFSMYTDDFTYVHEVYGGVYTREELYGNTAKYVESGHYQLTEGRYRILDVMAGLNAAAVKRLEVESGKVHLSVFEFEGPKLSRIIEYWK